MSITIRSEPAGQYAAGMGKRGLSASTVGKGSYDTFISHKKEDEDEVFVAAKCLSEHETLMPERS